jgi:hypothetical protein
MLDHARTGDKVIEQGIRRAVAIPVCLQASSRSGQGSASDVAAIHVSHRLMSFARPRNLVNLTGKSLRIFRNRVNPGNQKYSAFVLAQINRITLPVSPN